MTTSTQAAAFVIPSGIRRLRDARIEPGARWVYSAGFNTAGTEDTGRIDTELADLAYLADSGARVAVLSHQGRHRDGSARHLDHVTAYIGRRLTRAVSYVPENATDAAVRRAHSLEPGEIAVFGNTRRHEGEEANDPHLAARFAELGDHVAVGGFSKAHRRHASNVGVLEHLPGWAAHSLLADAERLLPWAGARAGTTSVAMLGGVKPEKTLVGLAHLARTYDVVVPGGVVLHHVLRALGVRIGASPLGEDPDRCAVATAEALKRASARIHIPSRLVIARRDENGHCDSRILDTADGVPDGYAVVDFQIETWLADLATAMAASGGRLLVAGTPCLHTASYTTASRLATSLAGEPAVESILLGGDTVAELPNAGTTTSTGGGSALHLVAHGTLPVFDALLENAKKR